MPLGMGKCQVNYLQEGSDTIVRCPKCGWKLKVIETRYTSKVVMRIRECTECKKRFYTKEDIVPKESIEKALAKSRTLAHVK